MDNRIIKAYTDMMGSKPRQKKEFKGKIVMLLAAGFSYNQGFPLGGHVNRRILSLKKDEFLFEEYGNLERVFEKEDNMISDLSKADTILQKAYNYLVDVITQYSSSLTSLDMFNYEDLYDGVDYTYDVKRKFDIMSDEYRRLSTKYADDFLTHEQIVYRLPVVLNYIIPYIIENCQDLSLYDNVTRLIESYPCYVNFLKFLQTMSESNIIDVFTLNHDTFFESFKNVNELGDRICDGFDDYGSEYYGNINFKGINYRCRLERYTGRYNRPIRLYKLHGSFDYYHFYKEQKTQSIPIALPQKIIKLKYGMNPLFVQKGKRSRMRYNNSLPSICYAEFLSGVEIKKKKYRHLYLYDKLLKHFKEKLSCADTVIIIGYSGNDGGINAILRKCISNSKTYILDSNPGDSIIKLKDDINAKLLIGDFDQQILELIS